MFPSINVPQASKYFRLNNMFDSPLKCFYHIESYLSDIKMQIFDSVCLVPLYKNQHLKQKLLNSNILQTHNAISTHITTL